MGTRKTELMVTYKMHGYEYGDQSEQRVVHFLIHKLHGLISTVCGVLIQTAFLHGIFTGYCDRKQAAETRPKVSAKYIYIYIYIYIYKHIHRRIHVYMV